MQWLPNKIELYHCYYFQLLFMAYFSGNYSMLSWIPKGEALGSDGAESVADQMPFLLPNLQW